MVVNMSTTKRMDLGLSAWAFVVAMGLVNCQDFFNLRLARWTQVQSLDRYQDVSWMKSQINYKWNNRIHEYKRFSMIQQWMIVHLFSIQSFYVCFFQVRRVLERWKTTWPWGVHNYRRSLGSKWQWNVALKSLSLRMVLARLHNGRMVAGIRLVQSAIQKARFEGPSFGRSFGMLNRIINPNFSKMQTCCCRFWYETFRFLRHACHCCESW